MTARIAIVTPAFPPYRGGIGQVAETDTRQLRAAGFDVAVIALSQGPALAGDEGVKRISPLLRYGHAGLCPGLARIWRNFDLVILHYPFYGGAEPLAFGRPKSGGARLAVFYHMDTVGHGAKGAIFALHRRFVMPRIIRRADTVLVTSFDYFRHSQIAGLAEVSGLRVRALPPSVDVEAFCPGPADSDLALRYGLAGAAGTILFVGGLDDAHYFKGVPNLLRALATPDLSGAMAVIVGQGNRRGEYEALADRLGVSGRVRFAGGVSAEELPAHHRLADAFAFPSVDRSEAFGIASLEALSSGVPVVASDLPGVRTIVRPGETGLLARPGSVSSLAVGLARILNDREMARRLGRNAREMAVREYADPVRAESLVGIVRETLL